ncbi:MAG: Gfo/Idh/MocA family oxidoreductase, partial [Verrucomicrobiota bacterium]
TDSYDSLLSRDDLTAAYIFGSNKVSEDLTVAACERGLHCLVEKPMAATEAGANRMLDAAEANGVRLMINWPFAWWPQLRHAMQLVSDGLVGQPWQVRYRAAHEGPVELGCSAPFCEWLYDAELNGAGALMDYCCYGAVLARALLGMPDRVSGTALSTGLKPDLKLEDNAVLLLHYPQALAVTEASWTQIGHLTSYQTVLYGSTGTLLVEPDHGGRLLHASAEHPDGVEVPIPESPPHLETASTHFLAAIEDPTLEIHPLCSAENGRDAQGILQRGIEAISAA